MPKYKMMRPLSEAEVKKTGVAQLRQEYVKLAEYYTRIFDRDLLYCPVCDDFHAQYAFYEDGRFPSGFYPECKEALKKQALNYDKKNDVYTDNKEKTIEVFRKLDLPFIDGIYERAVTNVSEGLRGHRARNNTSAYQNMLTSIKSLPQYRDMHFKDSQLPEGMRIGGVNTVIREDEEEEIRFARPEIKKIFGSGLTEDEYVYLQDKYDDFYKRTQVDSISQEQYVVLICFNLLNQWKAQREGRDTKDLIKSYNDLMFAANLQPKQNVGNAATDSLSFGQLIEKWEQEEPIPEPSPEFADVDGIGKYIRVWFFGHLCKALGIKNAYSKEYEDEVGQYTVERSTEDEDQENGEIYEKLFGKAEE